MCDTAQKSGSDSAVIRIHNKETYATVTKIKKKVDFGSENSQNLKELLVNDIGEIEFALDLSSPFDNRLEIIFSVIVEINKFDLPEFLLSENKFKSVPTPLFEDS